MKADFVALARLWAPRASESPDQRSMAAAHPVISVASADAQRPIVDFLNHQPLPLPLPLSWHMSMAHVLEPKERVNSNSR